MTNTPFIPAVLGADAVIAIEAAFGADLSDVDGSGWFWWGLTDNAQHNPGTQTTLGRADNVSQAGAAAFSATFNNASGDFTAGNPAGFFFPNVVQNTPVRERISLDDGATWATRFQGYLDSLNPTTDQSAKVKMAKLTALGALGRLAGQKKPLQSPMFRATQADAEVIAHWPMEDGADATSAASAKPGVGPMVALAQIGLPKFADGGPIGSVTGINFAAGALTGQVTNATAGSFRAQAAIRINNIAGPSATDILWSIQTSGGGLFELTYYTGTESLEWTYVSPNATGGTAFSSKASDGEWHLITINVLQSGSDIVCHTYVDGGNHFSFTIHTDTLGKITTVTVAAGNIVTTPVTGVISTDFNMSALSIASPATEPPPALTNTADALDGYLGETASDRLTRICAEEGIALDLRGTSAVTMGPQKPDTKLNIIRTCEAADHGLLYDGLGPGIGYQCRSDRYNATATLTLDMGAPREVTTLAPIFDKQATKNLYAVTRDGGSTATVERVDGPTGTDTIGVEDAAVTISIDTDPPLIQHAGFLVGLGTVPGFRFPNVAIDLRNVASKAADVLALLPGSRITIQNPASKSTDLPADDIDLIVEGWAEPTTADSWLLTFNTSPFAPYRVFVLDVDELDDPAVHLAL